MKRQPVAWFSTVGVIGLLGAASLTFAGCRTVVQVKEEQMADSPDRAKAVNDWRVDFEAALEEDAAYAAAVSAVEAYENKDDAAYDDLMAAQNQRYMEIAHTVYEKHFGIWQGSDEEFRMFVQLANRPTIKQCAAVAVETCGKVGVDSVKVISDSCEFTCKLKALND